MFLSSSLKLYFCKLCPFLDNFISFWLHKLRSFIISSNQLCVCVHFCFLLINSVVTRHIPKFSSLLSECLSKVLVDQDSPTLHEWHFEPGNYLLLGWCGRGMEVWSCVLWDFNGIPYLYLLLIRTFAFVHNPRKVFIISTCSLPIFLLATVGSNHKNGNS